IRSIIEPGDLRNMACASRAKSPTTVAAATDRLVPSDPEVESSERPQHRSVLSGSVGWRRMGIDPVMVPQATNCIEAKTLRPSPSTRPRTGPSPLNYPDRAVPTITRGQRLGQAVAGSPLRINGNPAQLATPAGEVESSPETTPLEMSPYNFGESFQVV